MFEQLDQQFYKEKKQIESTILKSDLENSTMSENPYKIVDLKLSHEQLPVD
jgi:hypothetical protein